MSPGIATADHLSPALLGSLGDSGFWISVGVLAGIYAIAALGVQLNAGFTGIYNFGQAGFMAIGAYSMGVLVVQAHVGFLLALFLAVVITIGFALVVGLSSLRLRADYFAIATIAFAEAVRLFLQNARGFAGGNQGLFGYDSAWITFSTSVEGWLESLGWTNPGTLAPLLIIVWTVGVAAAVLLVLVQRSPWGRVLRAIREDEDAARALGKNTLAYKLQSLSLSAGLAALSGSFLALNLGFLHPQEFMPLVTFISYAIVILGGLGSYLGVLLAAVVIWGLLEGTRFIDVPFTETEIAALRFMAVGAVLILLLVFRPEGIFGKREEMVLGD